MTLQAIVASGTILMLSVLALFLVRRLGGNRQILPVTTDWLNELSVERYRPMLRLLESADFEYVRSQKGYTAAMGRRLRQERAGQRSQQTEMFHHKPPTVDLQVLCITK